MSVCPSVRPSVCGQPENLPYYILLQHPGCSRMFQKVPECSKMFQDVPGCSRMFRDVQGCSRMFKDVCLSVPQVENSVCVHSFGMHKDNIVQACITFYMSVQHCTSMYKIVCTSMQLQKNACSYISLHAVR